MKHQEFKNNSHIANIEKKVWEGNRIINNLLSYSRIKTPIYENVHLFDLINECISTVSGRFQDYQVKIVKDYSDKVQSIEVDPHQIKEVFINILNNSFQALKNKTGVIEIIVRLEFENKVSIVIKDDGHGIDEEHLHKVFEPFFTQKAKGTGLGLCICNEIIHMHNGTIEIKSIKDEGTSLKIVMPIQKVNQ